MNSATLDATDALAPAWGTRGWFCRLLESQGHADPAAYFGLSGYHRYRHRQMVSRLKASLLPRERRDMLDIGCGTGHMTELIRRELGFASAIGLDFVDGLQTRFFHHYPNVEFRAGALPTLDFPAHSFDLVVAAEVLYYLSTDDRQRAVDEISRVLRPGGVLLFASAIGPAYFNQDSATELLSTRLRVVRTDFLYHRLFHATFGQLTRLRRLDQILHDGSQPGTAQTEQAIQRWNVLVRSPLVRFALKRVAATTRPMLDSTGIPALLHAFCARCIPGWTRTNLCLIATTPEE